MHRIDTSTAQVDKFGAGKNGFTGGNPQTGELPTALDENFFDSVQEEICNVIEGAGIALAKGTRNQLLSALKLLPRLSNLSFYTDTGAANAIVVSSTPAITELVDGQAFDVACAAANTGAVTMKVNALPAYPVIGPAGALQGGEIGAAKGVIRVVWSASKSSFLIVAQNTTGPHQVAPAAKSNQAVNLGQLNARAPNLQTFISNGSFTVPAGVTTLYLSGCGGGGGGGGGGCTTTTSNFGGGGGGGSAGKPAVKQAVTVTPGQVISVTIGAGGSAGTSAANTSGTTGGAGGSTIFGSLMTLAGGAGGAGGGGASLNGGGIGGVGYPNGGYGTDGNGLGTGNGGPGASGPYGGGGAAGRSSSGGSAAGLAGLAGYGNGVGGGGGSTGVNGVGGVGMSGFLFVEW